MLLITEKKSLNFVQILLKIEKLVKDLKNTLKIEKSIKKFETVTKN